MAEENAHDSEKAAQDIESLIKSAIVTRTTYFKDQADSLTFEGVRRLLEKDLGLEVHALDSHKRFVKQWLQNCIESPSPEKLPKSEGTTGDSAVSAAERESVNKADAKKEGSVSDGGETIEEEDSPVMGLLTGHKTGKETSNGVKESKSDAAPSEARIKKALWERASYIRENSQTMTLVGLRRLLEEDLVLEKHTLDSFKKFISQQVDEVINSPESPPKKAIDKKKVVKKDSHVKASSKSKKEEAPTTSGEETDDGSEEEVNVRKKTAPSSKLKKSAPVTKRKRAEEDTRGPKGKKPKASKPISEASDEENDGGVSGDDNSESSAEKPVKKKEVPKPSYGKQVERLKSVIKSCGLSIPPVIYKKVKEVPENKREACLIKELEKILSNEGLSTDPSEKDIKEVKKRKEKAKELEGIDLSNIVVSSRRRSAASYVPPPKPKIPELSESESEDSDNDDEDDDDDEDEDVADEDGEDEGAEDEEAVGEDQENGDDGSASEESDQDNGDSD
ncbi:uncharacterized protein LOC141604833 isoform X2 [Silene latifolia]|uniref:uncharacterized protein LOC141604833 isoform X2 n=1 Tax=Silene latifolia TaxID=37657 RepID=UPI003D786920